MKLNDTTYRLFSKEKAIETAKILNETDDWKYVPVHDPKETGYSFIEIYNEDGKFVGNI